MGVNVIGPDGRTYLMDDGTTPEEARRKIAEYTARERRGSVATAAALAGAPKKRSALERFGQDFNDTLQTSWIAEGFRAGMADAARIQAGGQPQAYESRGLLSLQNPAESVGNIVGSVVGIYDQLAGKKGLTAASTGMVADERARAQAFRTASAEDPWWKAEGGTGSKVVHGAAALVGTLGATGLDPLSYVTGGRSVVQRAFVQGGVAGLADLTAQDSRMTAGLTDRVDLGRTALSAAAGFTFSGAAELVAKGPKKWASSLFKDPEAAPAPLMDLADDVLAPAMHTAELPVIRAPEQPDLFDATPFAPTVRPEAPKATPDAPEVPSVRPQDTAGSAGAGPEAPKGEGFDTFDWGSVRSPERRAAAEAHLLTLRKAIKPEHAGEFLRLVQKGIDTAMPDGEVLVSHINAKYVDWDAVNGDPELILAWVKANEDIFSDLYTKAKVKDRVSFDQIAAASRLFGSNVSDIARAHANITKEGGISASIVAIKEAALGSDAALLTQMKDLKVKLANGTATDADRLAFASSMERTVMLDAMAKAATSEVARSLAVMKRMARPRALYDDVAADLADVLNKGRKVDNDDLLNAINKMEAAHAKGGSGHLRDTVRSLREWGFWDYAGYLANGALLAAPKTFIRNMAGPAIHTAMLIGDRYVGAASGAARAAVGQTGERITFREATAYTQAMVESLQEAFIIGRNAFEAGVPVTEGGSIVHPDQMPFVPYAMSPERKAKWDADGMTLGNILDRAMVGIFASTRAVAYRPMVASDEFYKTIGRRAQLSALAHREAAYRASKVDPLKANGVYADTLKGIQQEPTAEAVKAAKAYFADKGGSMDDVNLPGSTAEEMAMVLKSLDIRAAAVDHSRLLTFQDAGPLAAKMDQAIRAMPLIKYGFVNFVRTPLAIFRSAMVDRNPALAFLAKENRDALGTMLTMARDGEAALGRGGADADLLVGRLATGMTMMTVAWGLWAEGNLTGRRGGYGSSEQKDGVLPYSVRMPDGTWVQLTSLSPMAEPMKLIANVAEALHEHDMEDGVADALVSALLVGLSDATLGATMAQGVSDLLSVLGVSGGGGQTDQARTDASDRSLKKAVVPRVIPLSSLVKSVTQEFDPVRREVDSWVDAFKAYTPLLSKTLPARRDFLGRPEVIPEGQRGPFQAFPTSQKTKDPLMLELSRLAVEMQKDPVDPKPLALDKPPRRYNGREISFEEYGQLMEVQGQRVLDPRSGMNMEDHLRALVQMPEYQALSAPERAKEVKDAISAFRELGNKAVKDPRSPYYMGDMVRRTARERLLKETRANPLSPAMAARKARGYGLDLSTADPNDSDLQALRGVLTN